MNEPLTAELISTDMEIGTAAISIFEEVKRAEKLHPGFPLDIIHKAAIVAEESGELVQASLDYIYNGKPLEDVKKEAIHTAATCIRLLISLEREKK